MTLTDKLSGVRVSCVLSYGGKVLNCELVPGKSTSRVVSLARNG